MENLFTVTNITLFIALWGAFLSTAKVLSDFSKNTRKLKVQIAYGIQRQFSSAEVAISITGMNTGFRDITLNSWGYLLPDKKYMMSSPNDVNKNAVFPCTISEGKECSVWETQKQLATALRTNGYHGKIKLRGYFRSAIGTTYKSKQIDFDIEKALTSQ
jgi:hypothetical protein